jgi:hypothetical protein
MFRAAYYKGKLALRQPNPTAGGAANGLKHEDGMLSLGGVFAPTSFHCFQSMGVFMRPISTTLQRKRFSRGE